MKFLKSSLELKEGDWIVTPRIFTLGKNSMLQAVYILLGIEKTIMKNKKHTCFVKSWRIEGEEMYKMNAPPQDMKTLYLLDEQEAFDFKKKLILKGLE